MRKKLYVAMESIALVCTVALAFAGMFDKAQFTLLSALYCYICERDIPS